MNPKGKKPHPSMGGPATYRIHVRGHLAESWSNCMAGMKIIERRGTGGEVETILEGELADQAALSCGMNTLYGLHLPVISAQFIDEEDSSDIRDWQSVAGHVARPRFA